MTEKTLIFLPLDILVNIFKYLSLPELRNVMLTCKILQNIIINESVLWRTKSQNDLVLQCKCDIKLTWYNRCRISHNWCRGIFKNKVVIQHNTNYMPWLKFHNSHLFLTMGENLRCYSIDRKGFHRNNVLWSIVVPTVKRGDVRTNDISRFIYKDNMLICGNRDGCAAVYKIEDVRRRPVLLAHIKDCFDNGQVEVSAVEKVRDTIVTISNNSPSICFWTFNSEMDNEFQENDIRRSDVYLTNVIGCRCVAANRHDNQLAIGVNGNSKPILLDVNTSQLLMSSFEPMNYKQVVRDIEWRDEHIFMYVTHSGKLEVADLRTHNVVYQAMDPFQSSLYCVKSDSANAVIVGSSEYSRCVLYDLRAANHVQMYFTQKKMSPIYSLDFDTTRLMAAADRGVAVLNFNISAAATQPRDYSQTFQWVS